MVHVPISRWGRGGRLLAATAGFGEELCVIRFCLKAIPSFRSNACSAACGSDPSLQHSGASDGEHVGIARLASTDH